MKDENVHLLDKNLINYNNGDMQGCNNNILVPLLKDYQPTGNKPLPALVINRKETGLSNKLIMRLSQRVMQ